MNKPNDTNPSNTDQRTTPMASTAKPASSSYTNPTAKPFQSPIASSDGKPVDSAMGNPAREPMDKDSDIKAQWSKRISAAKLAWSKLSEAELLKSEGHEQKLATLVKERYSVSQEEADKQIKRFFETNPA